MSPLKLFAIAVIFLASCMAWVILGGVTDSRTSDATFSGQDKVGSLWGSEQTQQRPTFTARMTGADKRLPIESSRITADFALDQRKAGLMWFSTYAVDFRATYGVRNESTEAVKARMRFDFPTPDGVYDGFAVRVGGKELPVDYNSGAAVAEFEIPARATVTVETGYKTRGLDAWRYASSTEGVDVIKDLELVMRTDFDSIDFPADGVSPSSKKQEGDGWTLTWKYDSLVSGRPIGLVMPKPLNPGPVASRVSYFAPVSLLFYFAALVLITATRKAKVHPMNYAFLAAGFFAFHLLFAYLADRIDILAAFGVASAASLVLCLGYLSMFVKQKSVLIELAVGQFIFLILFSYSFFFEGLTGLAVTIGSVLTLAYFMLKTGHVDWEAEFAKSADERRQARLAAQAAFAQRPGPGGGTQSMP